MKMSHSKLVIGIPTVRRSRDYLVETLDSVIAGIPERARDRVEIVVFNADVPAEQHERFLTLASGYKSLVDAGMLTLITSEGHHRELDERTTAQDRRQALGESYWRWETKLVLDAARLMELCRARGDYYLHLEDDVVADNRFYERLVDWFDGYFAPRDDWAALCLAPPVELTDRAPLPLEMLVSTAGLLFRCRDLGPLVEYFREIHGEWPLDRALARRLQARGETMAVSVPAIIQHVGRLSSRAGVFRTHESPSFPESGVRRLRRHVREVRDVVTVSPGHIWRLLRMRRVLPAAVWEFLNRTRDAIRRGGRT